MKILLVSSYLPYPLFSGGHVRLYNLLRELSKKHEITLVCEKRKHQSQKDVDAVKEFCKEIITIDRKKQWSPEVIFQTAISSSPFLIAGHTLPKMQKVLQKLLQEKTFDVIHVETFYVYQNLPLTNIPTVLVEHNLEFAVYQRFVATAPFLLRPLLQIDVEKIKHFEKIAWEKATKVVGVSQKEARQMRSDAVVVPNGVDLGSFPYKPTRLTSFAQGKNKTKEITVLFLGDFKWIQNRNTVHWIIKEIWPQVESRIKNKELRIKLWIVGKHIPNNMKQYTSKSIIFDENASDKTSDIYKKADILLSPIKVGGGTSYKILEAMASGVPVVTTQLGIEGFIKPEEQVALVNEASEELADSVVQLLLDKKLFEKIRKNARIFIEKYYSWTEISKKLEEVYNDAIKK